MQFARKKRLNEELQTKFDSGSRKRQRPNLEERKAQLQATLQLRKQQQQQDSSPAEADADQPVQPESDQTHEQQQEERHRMQQELIEEDNRENDEKKKNAAEAKRERRRMKKKTKGKYKKSGSYCSAQLAGIEISDESDLDSEEELAPKKKIGKKGRKQRRLQHQEANLWSDDD